MTLSELCVRRPVATLLMMAGILVFGLLCYPLLPVSDLPNIDFPTIQVTATLPGASAKTMASAVATPLEKVFSTIDGIDSMNSSSTQGTTMITLQFALDRNIDSAALDVQSAISEARSQLPSDMPSPPSFRKLNPAAFPILFLAMTSDSIPMTKVDQIAETTIAPRLSTIRHVAQVEVFGAQKFAVRVQLDPDALAARHIGIGQVADAIRRNNVNLPTGTLDGPYHSRTIEANGQLNDAADYRPLIVAYRNGAPVRLKELGRVIDGVQNDKVAAWYNNKNAVLLAIERQPGSNTVNVVDAVKKKLPALEAELPAGVHLRIVHDRSDSIRTSVSEVRSTLLIAFALVVLVIFLFLRNWRATVIPTLALPMSVIGTFSAMYLFGFSIDILSLMALTLSVGFVVDDAIVMLENIDRHVEMGKSPMQATLDGSREVGFTIISMTLSLAAVFIPVVFMGGIVGKLLFEFGVTIMAAVMISGFVSLTLTPMLCSRVLAPVKGRRHGRWYLLGERLFDRFKASYDRSLAWVLVHKRTTMAAFGLVFIATAGLFAVVPKGFLPPEDTGALFIQTEAAQDISFKAMVAQQKKVAEVVLANPNVLRIASFLGSTRTSQNSGRMFVRLKPADERVGAAEVTRQLRSALGKLPDVKSYVQQIGAINIGGKATKSQYQYTLQSTDSKALYHWATVLEDKLDAEPQFIGVTSDLEIANPQAVVDIDRSKASALGVSAQTIEQALYDAYGSGQVSTIYTATDEYWVILELEPRFTRDASALSKLYVSTDDGKLVPLTAIASVHDAVGPLTINHLGQVPAVTLSFDLAKGYSLGDAVAAINATVHKLEMPASVTGSFQGTAQAFQSSFGNMGLLLLLTVVFIYLVLGILYESFIHPITILSSLPTAGLGALLMLLLFGEQLNLYSFVGIIMLIGIVKKNAIMMIDFAITAQRDQGLSPTQAAYQACLIRFRPIMMTTMAALMGALPIAFGFGAVATGRQPLGLAVLGGLLVSQMLTLFITPVIYIYFEAAKSWLLQRVGPGHHADERPVHK